MKLSIHHVAVICSNLDVSKRFYTEALGFKVIRETYREERKSWKVDLDIDGTAHIELFSFPAPPQRVTGPEACGLRHLAFQVGNMEEILEHVSKLHIASEPIRTDELTGKRFTFVKDPDGLPIEFYEK